ncbi:MAG TPA: nuclease-related domain-containing protein [Streptomyces sp.]|nr:nuclease-related domain-containing protein [Streptomyces sp.]
MAGLRISPWKRYGHDRLYVNLPDGTSVAWFDRKTGRIAVLIEEHRDRALGALAPYLSTAAAHPVARVLDATLPPGEDIAAHRPGQAVRAKLGELAPSTWRYLLLRMLGRRSEADRWRLGLKGERIVGAELERMTGKGWRVLHSVPLPRDVDIDHLLVGPGGVFCVNTKHHPDAVIWVGDDSVKIGGQAYPYVSRSRREACARPRCSPVAVVSRSRCGRCWCSSARPRSPGCPLCTTSGCSKAVGSRRSGH